MPLKTLEEYILQYGEVSGTKRFLGIQKSMKSKEEKYAKQPFTRLTKEWYIWRYGQEIGEVKFDLFAGKCIQNLDNFIKRHGEEEGLRMYQQCMSKKDTRQIIRVRDGDEAVKILNAKIGVANKGKVRSIESRQKSSAAHKKLNLVSKRDRFIAKYGKEEGVEKYLEHKKKVYAGPNRATRPVLEIIDLLKDRLPKEVFDRLYFGARGRQEYFLKDKDTNEIFFYDIVDPKTKVIIEYDGAFWHPKPSITEMPALSKITHPVTKQSLSKMLWHDCLKRAVVDENHFELFSIHENDLVGKKEQMIDWFCYRATSFNLNGWARV